MMLVDGGQPRTEHATLSEWYAHGEQLLGGACPLDLLAHHGYCEPIGRPFTALMADDECAHGRLAGDATDECGCWPSELPEPELLEPTAVVHPDTPDLMFLLAPRKEPLMLTAAPERLALPPGPAFAPFGLKLDGTPRKSRAGRKANPPKPAPAPAPDPVRVAIEAAANLEPATPVRPTTVVHATTPPLLARIVAEIDAEIARLETARAALLTVIA